MTLDRTIALALALGLGAAAPAAAGQPDNPGEKGQLVNERKDFWEEKRGDPNAWGQRVSEIASAAKGNSEGNLGGYLDDETEGPNPDADMGGGND